MFELLEKTLLAGIGTLSLTRQKTEELVTELQKQYNLSEEKGRELLSKFENAARDNQKVLEDLAQQEVRQACERMGVATSAQLETLSREIDLMQKRIKTLEERTSRQGDSYPGPVE